MASEKHDFIVAAISRRIKQYGFSIVYLHGREENIASKDFQVPPTIINHKPDIVGFRDLFFCIGEAKTENDLACDRTKNQIIDFLAAVKLAPENKLILGIPLRSKPVLINLLSKLECKDHPQIEIICVPEELFPRDANI